MRRRCDESLCVNPAHYRKPAEALRTAVSGDEWLNARTDQVAGYDSPCLIRNQQALSSGHPVASIDGKTTVVHWKLEDGRLGKVATILEDAESDLLAFLRAVPQPAGRSKARACCRLAGV
jgi:hypothetical protein